MFHYVKFDLIAVYVLFCRLFVRLFFGQTFELGSLSYLVRLFYFLKVSESCLGLGERGVREWPNGPWAVAQCKCGSHGYVVPEQCHVASACKLRGR